MSDNRASVSKVKRKVRAGSLEQPLEAVDCEIATLVIVNATAGAHDAQQVDQDAVGLGIVQVVERCALAGMTQTQDFHESETHTSRPVLTS